MATDPTMELFSSVSPSAPPGDGDDVYDAREREIEGGGGGGDDAPGTLHLAVSQTFPAYLAPRTPLHVLTSSSAPIYFSHHCHLPKRET